MTRTAALIVAAGQGTRAGQSIPKQYAMIGGRAVLAHAIDALLEHPMIDTVQVVIGAGQEALYAAAIGNRPLPAPIIGGATRRDSVIAGLRAIDADIVLIHDAARPFLPPAVIDRLLAALENHDGAIPALPVADTLTTADGKPVPATACSASRHPRLSAAPPSSPRMRHGTRTPKPPTMRRSRAQPDSQWRLLKVTAR